MKALVYTVLYQPMYNLLIFLAWLIPGHSMAISIILITIIIRLALLPSSLKAAHLQVKNAELQPKINKIRSEIKDQKEQSKAMMDLYKEEGISPFGSCLPLLIQLPILWVLFSVFRHGLNGTEFSGLYSFMPRPDSINLQFIGFDITKPDLWILPITAGALQFLLSYLMMPKNVAKSDSDKDPTAMMTKQMLYFMPLITVFIGRSMPAALVIYWIATTVFSIFQQLYVNKEIKKAKEQKESMPTIESKPKISPEVPAPIKPKSTKDMLMKMMNKRLEKQEKKAGVNVTVRTKK